MFFSLKDDMMVKDSVKFLVDTMLKKVWKLKMFFFKILVGSTNVFLCKND